jgi:hypothetical protein
MSLPNTDPSKRNWRATGKDDGATKISSYETTVAAIGLHIL